MFHAPFLSFVTKFPPRQAAVEKHVVTMHRHYNGTSISSWYKSLVYFDTAVRATFRGRGKIDSSLPQSDRNDTKIMSSSQNLVTRRTDDNAVKSDAKAPVFNPLKPELYPICYLLALLAHHFLHVSRIRVKSLTFRWLMSYIYGAPILDVSRSHTTTQHSR